MTRNRKLACAGCDRTFLSERARRHHYRWNPTHEASAATETGPAEIAGIAADERSTGTEPAIGDEWVVFDDRIETFLTVDDDRDGGSLRVEYRPSEELLVVSGPIDRRLDVSAVRRRASGRFRWSFDGTYLVLSVPIES